MTAFGDRPAQPDTVPGALAVVQRRGAAPSSGWHYTPELGQWIAEEYAECEAGGLWDLARAWPDRMPPAGVVRAWRRQHPAFGLLMNAAEATRAEKLMEEAVVLADTSPLAAPRVALQIAARQRLAESLDAARWKPGAKPADGAPQLGHDAQPTAPELTDDALRALAAAGLPGPGADGGSPP